MTKPTYRSYEEARKWARNSGIKTKKAWFEAYDKGDIPNDIPKYPDKVYGHKKDLQ